MLASTHMPPCLLLGLLGARCEVQVQHHDALVTSTLTPELLVATHTNAVDNVPVWSVELGAHTSHQIQTQTGTDITAVEKPVSHPSMFILPSSALTLTTTSLFELLTSAPYTLPLTKRQRFTAHSKQPTTKQHQHISHSTTRTPNTITTTPGRS